MPTPRFDARPSKPPASFPLPKPYPFSGRHRKIRIGSPAPFPRACSAVGMIHLPFPISSKCSATGIPTSGVLPDAPSSSLPPKPPRMPTSRPLDQRIGRRRWWPPSPSPVSTMAEASISSSPKSPIPLELKGSKSSNLRCAFRIPGFSRRCATPRGIRIRKSAWLPSSLWACSATRNQPR